jgi:hypothetical protein
MAAVNGCLPCLTFGLYAKGVNEALRAEAAETNKRIDSAPFVCLCSVRLASLDVALGVLAQRMRFAERISLSPGVFAFVYSISIR